VKPAASILAIVAVCQSLAAASPLPAKDGFVRANGIKLHYVNWGAPATQFYSCRASMTALTFTITSRHVLLTTSMH